jgi:hypothetical protein
MAKTHIIVTNGAVVLPAGYALDSQSMRIHESQATEDVSSYGGTAYNIFLGTGSTKQDISVTGFPYKGVTASNPGFGSMNGTAGALGGSAVFTIDTGCTLTGGYLCNDLSMDHSRLVAGAKTTLALQPSSEIVPVWATS